MTKQLKSPATYLALLVLASIFFWAEMVFFDKIPFFRDTLLQFYPWQSFANNSLSGGTLPLWNNYSGGGAPFIGNLQSAVFYPLKLFFVLLPFGAAVKSFIILNFIIAAFGMFFLVRDFKISSSSAFFAALIFSFNGYLVSRVEFWSVLGSSVWLPAIMFFLKRFIDSGKFKYFLFAVFSLAMPLLAGSAQIYFYNFIILTAFTVWYAVSSKKLWWPSFCYFLAASVLSLLLSSIQLFPFLEFVSNSVRQAGMDINLASTWSLHPFKLVNFLTPYFWGNPSESAYFGSDQFWAGSFYCGIPVIALFLTSVLFFFKKGKGLDRKTRGTVIFFSLLLTVFFVLSLGRYGFLYNLLYKFILPFRMIRYPAVAIYGAVFAVSVLGGLLAGKIAENIKDRKLMKTEVLSSAMVLLVTAGLYIYVNYFKTGADPVRIAVTARALITAGGLLISLAAVFYLVSVKKAKADTLIFLLSGLLLFDLFINTSGIIPLGGAKEVFLEPAVKNYLKADNSDFRIATTPGTYATFGQLYESSRTPRDGYPYKSYLNDIKSMMYDNYSMFCGLECFNVYDPMRLKRQEILAYRFKNQNSAFETNLLNIFNVKYCLSNTELKENGLVLRTKLDGIFIYENKKVLPRAYVVYNTLHAKDAAAAFEKVTAKDFLPLEYAVLEEPGPALLPKSTFKAEEAGVIYPSAERVIIDFNAVKNGLLVLSDAYYPGWEAEVDGVKTKILRTNYMFRGVIIPAGRHTVEMGYRPLSFRVGVAVTTVTLIFLLLVSVWIWERKISL